MSRAASLGFGLVLSSQASATAHKSRPVLDLRVAASDGSYEISIDGQHWTSSAGPPRLHADGAWMDLEMLTKGPLSGSTKKIEWGTADGGPVLSTSFTTYSEDPSRVTFEQCILKDLAGTAVDSDVDKASEAILSAFPNFRADPSSGDGQRRGFFGYNDQMVGGMEKGTHYGEWGVDEIPGGSKAGPVIVFNEAHGTGAIAISPSSNFMGQSGVYNTTANALEFGLLGSISSVPAGLCSSVAVVADWTPTKAVKALGASLLATYGKEGRQWDSDDQTIAKVSYSTDNGAFYYYNAYPFDNAQAALEKLLTSTEHPLPIGSVLLDSWWYYKGQHGGVTDWRATEDWFPDGGLPGFHAKVPLPIVAHNRYWSNEAVYAKENGGQYDFIIEAEKHTAIPMDQRFWDDLLGNATRNWGLAVYEQDWLHNEWEKLDVTRTNATLSQTWLDQMGNAATKAGIKIQYCMAYTRFALASVLVPAVDQIRVSDDYAVDLERTHPNMKNAVNLYIGTSSLLAGALGLAPSKDVFWSTAAQPGAPAKYKNNTAPVPELHAVVSALSAGPLAVGDAYGYTNASLLAMTCMSDGTLLKPSWPAVSIDQYHTQRALGFGGPQGEVTYTYSTLWHTIDGAPGHFTVNSISVLAMDLEADYALNISSLPELDNSPVGGAYFVYKTLMGFMAVGKSEVSMLSPGSELVLPACGKEDYSLYNVMPAFEYPLITVLGEMGKFVPTSPKRFLNVDTGPQNGGSLQVVVAGSPGEKIEIMYGQLAREAGGKPKLSASSCVVPTGATQCTVHGGFHQSSEEMIV